MEGDLREQISNNSPASKIRHTACTELVRPHEGARDYPAPELSQGLVGSHPPLNKGRGVREGMEGDTRDHGIF